jgi:hypothetical protein
LHVHVPEVAGVVAQHERPHLVVGKEQAEAKILHHAHHPQGFFFPFYLQFLPNDFGRVRVPESRPGRARFTQHEPAGLPSPPGAGFRPAISFMPKVCQSVRRPATGRLA